MRQSFASTLTMFQPKHRAMPSSVPWFVPWESRLRLPPNIAEVVISMAPCFVVMDLQRQTRASCWKMDSSACGSADIVWVHTTALQQMSAMPP